MGPKILWVGSEELVKNELSLILKDNRDKLVELSNNYFSEYEIKQNKLFDKY